MTPLWCWIDTYVKRKLFLGARHREFAGVTIGIITTLLHHPMRKPVDRDQFFDSSMPAHRAWPILIEKQQRAFGFFRPMRLNELTHARQPTKMRNLNAFRFLLTVAPAR